MRYYERNMPALPPLREKRMRYLGVSCPVPIARYPEEYHWQSEIRLSCTQHQGVTSREQRKITDNWVDFLKNNSLPLETVVLSTRTPQDVFDAICCQESITELYFKWCAVPDLSSIGKLRKLKKLYIGHGASILTMEPLAELKELEALRLGNTIKVTDYSPIGKLTNLREFSIEGNDNLTPVILNMESDAFLQGLTKLEYLDLYSVNVWNRSFLYRENTEYISSVMFRL